MSAARRTRVSRSATSRHHTLDWARSRALRVALFPVLLTAVMFAAFALPPGNVARRGVQAGSSGSGCVLSGGAAPAFCDTFDQPMGTGNRSGQLNGTVWGVSRISDDYNIGQSQYDVWFPSTSSVCNTAPVNSPNDVQVCNGQFAETSNDGHQFGCTLGCGDQTVLAASPKHPFDFAGRTGHVVFDLGDDSQGIHAAWPAFAITDL